MKKRIRIQGFLIFLALVTSILLSKSFFLQWKQAGLDEFLDSLGVSIVLFGFLIRIVARGLKEERSQNGNRLVIDGLYRLARHPMYLGTFLIGLGIILVLYNGWAILILLFFFLLIYIPQTNREEKLLTRRFGDAYKEYCQKTPRYFPNPIILFKIDLMDYLYFKWLWLKKEIASMVIVFMIIFGIEAWEDLKLFGYIEYRKGLLELSFVMAFFIVFFNIFYQKEHSG